ncbi:MAG: hypothetical protein WBA84_07650 [Carnobacterium sp.]|uniref:hypothetical protein n=1 Tax=Carnobacterium sp. TaxID=48221 RepID=UPI003C73CE92
MAKIYFSKFNMSEISEKIQDNSNFLNKTLKELFTKIDSKQWVDSEDDDNIYYRLYDVEKNFKLSTVSGRLLKVERNKEIDTLDGDEVETFSMKNAFSSIAFSFHIYEEVIAFVPKIDFKKEEFHCYLGKILTASYPEIKDVNFKLMPDKDSLQKKLLEIDKTTSATFILVPPNGIADDAIKDIVDILSDTDTTEAELTLKGERSKPIKKDSKTFKELVQYIMNGWGYLKITGYSDEKRKNINIDTSKELLKTEPISETNKNSHKYIENKVFGRDD